MQALYDDHGPVARGGTTRNQAILASCKSSGNFEVDQQLLQETRDEVQRGWAVGLFREIPEGCFLSRRFALVQRNKTRMIDDYTISGINDTAASQSRVDLHMVDTFAAAAREFSGAVEMSNCPIDRFRQNPRMDRNYTIFQDSVYLLFFIDICFKLFKSYKIDRFFANYFLEICIFFVYFQKNS